MIWRTLTLTMCAAAALAAESDSSLAPSDLGVSFIDNSTSTLVLERSGRKYLVDVAARSVRAMTAPEAAGAADSGKAVFRRNCATCHGEDGKGKAAVKTPDFTDPKVQASITDAQIVSTIRNGRKGTAMPAWAGKLSDGEIAAVASYLRSFAPPKSRLRQPVPGGDATAPKDASIYHPGDDLLMSLPTGRPPEARALYVNFTHRFAFDPAFTGPARGGSLAGLDGVAIASFGFRYGITDRLSVSAYRSPSLMSRPIQLMAAYHVFEESAGRPLNAAVRFSIEGQNDFAKNYTENLELILSRSITGRAQLYFVPTLSFNDRRLVLPASFRSGAIPILPGYNTFSTGVGLAVDIRPSVALVAEVIPTLVNGRPLAIHRPAYAFGIQKKIWRHAFTFGFTNSPGSTVSQRAGTRASYLGNPSADKPGGLFIGFDIMRQFR